MDTINNHQLEGLRIAITGTVPGIKRRQLQAAIERHGGVYQSSSVTKTTNLLVLGRRRRGHGRSRKEKRALILGVTCLDWELFYDEYLTDVPKQLELFV